MICSVFITLICLAIAAAGFGWHDPFHVLVGGPALVLVGVVSYLIYKRSTDDEVEDDDPPGMAHRVVMGMLSGSVAIGVLAGSYALASGIGLKDAIEGPSCHSVVARLQDFARIEAYAGLVADVDASLQERWAPMCRNTLRALKVRALLDWAESGKALASERLGLIEQAVETACTLSDADLQGRAVTSLEAEKQRRRTAELERLAEILRGKHFPVEETEEWLKIILTGKKALRFASNQAELNEQARASIRDIAEQLKREPFNNRRIRIIGHTDSLGNNHMKLSKERAQSVFEELKRHGIREERLEVEGRGDQEPILGNDTEEERAQNRRVEIIVQKREGWAGQIEATPTSNPNRPTCQVAGKGVQSS